MSVMVSVAPPAPSTARTIMVPSGTTTPDPSFSGAMAAYQAWLVADTKTLIGAADGSAVGYGAAFIGAKLLEPSMLRTAVSSASSSTPSSAPSGGAP
jgi:hypothetical protein